MLPVGRNKAGGNELAVVVVALCYPYIDFICLSVGKSIIGVCVCALRERLSIY